MVVIALDYEHPVRCSFPVESNIQGTTGSSYKSPWWIIDTGYFSHPLLGWLRELWLCCPVCCRCYRHSWTVEIPWNPNIGQPFSLWQVVLMSIKTRSRETLLGSLRRIVFKQAICSMFTIFSSEYSIIRMITDTNILCTESHPSS